MAAAAVVVSLGLVGNGMSKKGEEIGNVLSGAHDVGFHTDQSYTCSSSTALQQGTPLNSGYSFWYMKRGKQQNAANKEQEGEGGAGGANPYESAIRNISTVKSVEEFWTTYNYLVRPNSLTNGTDYHFFREGIKPTVRESLERRFSIARDFILIHSFHSGRIHPTPKEASGLSDFARACPAATGKKVRANTTIHTFSILYLSQNPTLSFSIFSASCIDWRSVPGRTGR